ncbi:MAG: hypothetical protein PUJ46_03995 [Alistipes sp.]|nr:hypothetical protein [Alistipes sp.]
MKTKIVRGIQLFWAYFIALGAVVGFGMMIYDPSGVTFQMDPLLPQLREAFPFLSLYVRKLHLVCVRAADRQRNHKYGFYLPYS